MLRKLANTEITVRDWTAQVDWYVNKLGLEVAYEEADNQWCVLSIGEGRSGLILRGVPDVDTSAGGRVVPQIQTDDLDATLAELVERGVQPVGGVSEATRRDGRSYRWFRLRDPEGNLLRVYEGQV